MALDLGVGIAALEDVKVKASATDSTTGFLADKLTSSDASVTISTQGAAGTNQQINLQVVGGGEANTGTNLGGGSQVFKQKSGVDFEFRTLTAGANITLNQSATEVEIVSTGGGETNTASNVGTGLGKVFKQKTGVDLEFKSIAAGAGISVTNGTNDVTVASTLSFGSNNQIPTTNASTDDFDYSSNFTYDGTTLTVASGKTSTTLNSSGGQIISNHSNSNAAGLTVNRLTNNGSFGIDIYAGGSTQSFYGTDYRNKVGITNGGNAAVMTIMPLNQDLHLGVENISHTAGLATSTVLYIRASNRTAAIGTTSPAVDAMLEVNSTVAGFLPPRVTTAQRNNINGGSPTEGLVIYNSDNNDLEFHDGTNWAGTARISTGTYTRNATVVEDRTLLASASATATNNNNVLAALIADLQSSGVIG